MIPVSIATLDTTATSEEGNWQKALAQSFKTVDELLNYLGITTATLPYSVEPNASFRLRVTRYFADLINPADPYDPILMQVLPIAAEQIIKAGYTTDPLEEAHFSPVPGVIHKYTNRVLLIAHQACAIHCRYCFRRHFPYSEQSLKGPALDKAMQYIASQPQVNEVILSGGDPLSLGDSALALLLEKIDQLPNINTIRLHSRTPVVEPTRINETLISSLSALNSQLVMVLHCNHPNEITTRLQHKLAHLKTCGLQLLNQSVLLKGINDDVQTMVQLSNRLFASGILPYYLHVLDSVQGTHHFSITDQQANAIWQQMQAQLSGYLLPRLVREIPQRSAKTWINSNC